jgi:hypothetical protein
MRKAASVGSGVVLEWNAARRGEQTRQAMSVHKHGIVGSAGVWGRKGTPSVGWSWMEEERSMSKTSRVGRSTEETNRAVRLSVISRRVRSVRGASQVRRMETRRHVATFMVVMVRTADGAKAK